MSQVLSFTCFGGGLLCVLCTHEEKLPLQFDAALGLRLPFDGNGWFEGRENQRMVGWEEGR